MRQECYESFSQTSLEPISPLHHHYCCASEQTLLSGSLMALPKGLPDSSLHTIFRITSHSDPSSNSENRAIHSCDLLFHFVKLFFTLMIELNYHVAIPETFHTHSAVSPLAHSFSRAWNMHSPLLSLVDSCLSSETQVRFFKEACLILHRQNCALWNLTHSVITAFSHLKDMCCKQMVAINLMRTL